MVQINLYLCFFFKPETAYEMRISDWSSDVCSSDLEPLQRLLQHAVGNHETAIARVEQELDDVRRQVRADIAVVAPHREVAGADLHRCQAAERALHARLALFGIHAGGAEHLRRGRIQLQRRIALAPGLLGSSEETP